MGGLKRDKSIIIPIILDGMRRGMTRKVACAFAGISLATLDRWIEEDNGLSIALKKAKAEFADSLLPLAMEKEPWKMLKSAWKGEYTDTPDVAVQVNIDRPLLNAPSDELLKMLKLAKEQSEKKIEDWKIVDEEGYEVKTFEINPETKEPILEEGQKIVKYLR